MKLQELLKTTRNPHRIANATGKPLRDVRSEMKGEMEDLPGWGPVEKQRFIVSRRHVYDPAWPFEDMAALQDAKRLHDRGRVTMAQGRDGEYFIQYAFPESKPVKRRPFFYEEEDR